MDPRGDTIQLPGQPTTEPTFGLPAMWVPEDQREEASFRGYTVVDPSTVITTHMTEIIKDNMAELLSRSEEHTSELQSLMRISYAVFCLKNKNNTKYKP